MAFRQPNPLNQFYRLDLEGSTWVKTTRWGTEFDSTNCMAAQGAVALDAHTDGRITTTPPGIRNRQSDTDWGIGVDDVQVAWRWWGQVLWTPEYVSWADVMGYLRDGRFVILGIDYDQVPTIYKAQQSYYGDHAVGLNQTRSDGRVQMYDSLGTKPIWVPQSAVRPGAEKLARRVRNRPDALFAGVTRARAPLNPYAGWGSDVPRAIKTGVSLADTRAAIRKTGLNYGSVVNMVDLRAACKRALGGYGTAVNLVDVQALIRWSK